jgi:hypothetical protein
MGREPSAAERITFTGTAFFFISSRIGAMDFSEIPSAAREPYNYKIFRGL